MDGTQIVEIVTIVVGAIVSIATLYQQFKLRQLERKLDSTRREFETYRAIPF